MTFPAVLIVVAVWAVLAWLAVGEPMMARRRRERAEVERCGRVTYITDAPRWQRDPSPRRRGGDAA